MQGASALQQVLLKHPQDRIEVLALWEPVLWTDLAPPRSHTLTRLSDPRVQQFWDKDRLVSEALITFAREHPDTLTARETNQLARAKVVWDFVGVFPPGTRWTNAPPFPKVRGHPVVNAIGDIEQELAALGAGRR